MRLRAEVLSAYEDDCKRGHVRHLLSLPVEGAMASDVDALVHNLSKSGMLIETLDDLTVGEIIQVELPEASARSVKVVWKRGQLFGCQFEQPIAKASVSASLLRSPPNRTAEVVTLPTPLEPSPIMRGYDVEGSHDERWPLRTRASIIVGLTLASWTLVGLVAALVTLQHPRCRGRQG